MISHTTTSISSFVIRFVMDASNTDEKRSTYRGSVRHIQSAEELNFSTWREAVEFISRFVPLEEYDDGKTLS